MKKNIYGALFASLVLAQAAQATVIDFNGNGSQDYFVASVSSNGFVVTRAQAGDYNLGTSDDFDSYGTATNGSVYLTAWSNSSSSTGVTLVSGTAALFSAQGFDFDNAYPVGQFTSTLSVIGTYADMTTHTQTFMNLESVQAWTSFALDTGFTGLQSLDFVADGQPSVRALFDNIIVDQAAAVPEPASMALVGLALAGLAMTRRKQA